MSEIKSQFANQGRDRDIAQRVDSHLGDRNWLGRLTLVYRDSNDTPKTRIIPFFENPTILESQNPRYMNYAVVGRSSNLFGYLGADSRKFNISFKISIPNISTYIVENSSSNQNPATKLQKQKEIIKNTESGSKARNDAWSKLASTQNEHKEKGFSDKFFTGIANELDEDYQKVLFQKEENLQKILSYSSPAYDINSDVAQMRRKTLNYVMDTVASIRSSVINNSINPQYGPPLVRLDWGIMFRDVPCVCKGYTINVNDKAGYDKKTLLPRSLEVTMALEEARSLSNANPINEGDKIVGWEVLVGTDVRPGLTMDPKNFDTTRSN